mmetsp:Transcript_14677/g.39294  ORF Transcript_14677/g.39294 Transcript_14677/m.39294 type:complete len:122 (-) Transcript_14677:374-739(-)
MRAVSSVVRAMLSVVHAERCARRLSCAPNVMTAVRRKRRTSCVPGVRAPSLSRARRVHFVRYAQAVSMPRAINRIQICASRALPRLKVRFARADAEADVRTVEMMCAHRVQQNNPRYMQAS